MPKENGVIVYHARGIVVILTGLTKKSANDKTGAMLQTWILRDDVDPWTACKTGQDSAICFDCPHRGYVENGKLKGRTCYVRVYQAPKSVYQAFKRGKYRKVGLSEASRLCRDRKVRIGSYGDPYAVPVQVWKMLTKHAAGWTGYTHQATRAHKSLSRYCMASADTLDESKSLQDKGWRTFRVADPKEWKRARGEVLCPASKEAGSKTSCTNCNLCKGCPQGAEGIKSVVIPAHGAFASKFRKSVNRGRVLLNVL